jgi:hypothetical protein
MTEHLNDPTGFPMVIDWQRNRLNSTTIQAVGGARPAFAGLLQRGPEAQAVRQ